jgi:hypothetical protein
VKIIWRAYSLHHRHPEVPERGEGLEERRAGPCILRGSPGLNPGSRLRIDFRPMSDLYSGLMPWSAMNCAQLVISFASFRLQHVARRIGRLHVHVREPAPDFRIRHHRRDRPVHPPTSTVDAPQPGDEEVLRIDRASLPRPSRGSGQPICHRLYGPIELTCRCRFAHAAITTERTISSRPFGARRAFLCVSIRSSKESLKSQQPQLPRPGPNGQSPGTSQLD